MIPPFLVRVKRASAVAIFWVTGSPACEQAQSGQPHWMTPLVTVSALSRKCATSNTGNVAATVAAGHIRQWQGPRINPHRHKRSLDQSTRLSGQRRMSRPSPGLGLTVGPVPRVVKQRLVSANRTGRQLYRDGLPRVTAPSGPCGIHQRNVDRHPTLAVGKVGAISIYEATPESHSVPQPIDAGHSVATTSRSSIIFGNILAGIRDQQRLVVKREGKRRQRSDHC